VGGDRGDRGAAAGPAGGTGGRPAGGRQRGGGRHKGGGRHGAAERQRTRGVGAVQQESKDTRDTRVTGHSGARAGGGGGWAACTAVGVPRRGGDRDLGTGGPQPVGGPDPRTARRGPRRSVRRPSTGFGSPTDRPQLRTCTSCKRVAPHTFRRRNLGRIDSAARPTLTWTRSPRLGPPPPPSPRPLN